MALSLMAFCGCESLVMDEQSAGAPVVGSFSPKAAPIGATVEITGENLHNVNAAYIGGSRVDIVTKVSNTSLTIKVTNEVTSGKILLVSPEGEGMSAEEFHCSFAVPEIIASTLPASAELGESILISGRFLNSASAVIFTAEGQTEGHEAVIVNRNDEEMVVKVPYVEDADASITLMYFDGEKEVETAKEAAPQMNVIRRVPTFETTTFERTAVGKSVTLRGANLNNVDKITVGDFEAQIASKTTESLVFTIPAGNFADGETTVELTAHYFSGYETVKLDESFLVYVPFLKFWENIVSECQSQDAANGMFASFFSPENGRVYANNLWATELDPVAMRLQGAQFHEGNVFKPDTVTEEEYNNTLPYIFFSVSGGKNLQINSPANSNSQLKNFVNDANISSSNRVPGNNNSKASGLPILAFRCLNKDNAAEAALINKVVNGTLENINEELFPIDETAKTIAGIGFNSASGGVKDSNSPNWPGVVAPSPYSNTSVDLKDKNCVFLVAYYSYNGYNKDNRVQNIRRLGIIHLTKVNWIVSNNDLRGTQVTYNCYWQKYDYDYSKLGQE